MATKAALWQKSLGPVTSITLLIHIDCDAYHGSMYEASLLTRPQKPRIAACH